ncbi:ubiquitin-protein ligase sel1 [Niveomyces insectorum RCEF 264]|uniref:Ubiquitin-protein ligase sel1 n=1 Tax=Niveomyces insectorum RCEF 264 TaxID=1081102 RepID=A0A167WFS5_9HYPO|nr:ubiquitin-protein ligase sel1 [Niveomyces insectorum RCEF 264]
MLSVCTKVRTAENEQERRRQDGMLSTALRLVLKAAPSFSMRGPPPAQPQQQQQAASQNVVSHVLLQAVELLEEASSRHNNPDAIYLLAEMNFYGNYSHPRNFPASFDYYRRLADDHGNSSAMYMVGLMYSTGIGNAVEMDQARALLYYTFAALRGHTRAEMTVAARHHAGVGTPRSCDEALKYYKRVADKAITWYRSGPPGGMGWVQQPYRIADEVGGVYGEGASAVSSGINAMRAQPHSDAYASIDDIIEYLDLMAQKGDFKAALNVGRIYYEGQRSLERDMTMARKYFLMVASKYWRKDGRVVENPKPTLDKTAGKAAGYLGRIHMRGDGLEEPNFDRARSWFERGISQGDAQSQYYMGLMLRHGYGGMKNLAKATELFRAAAEQDFAPAQVELGVLYLDQGQPEDLRIANDYFELAARYGNVEAFYYLAEMIHHGVGRDKACAPALAYYKSVAEKADPLVSSWTEANQAYESGDYELALLEYLGAAEQGYEKAQNNIGYLLDPQQSTLQRLPSWFLRPQGPKQGLMNNSALGLVHWTRSSRQNNVDALVKMGDYYLYGIGTDRSVDKAVQCYTGASEYHQSAQALFNLGWMHENGVGLDQDFHLAKRYYDIALTTNEEAYLPVTLSLLKLRLRSAWNTLTHGQINSIQDEPAPARSWSLKEWIDTFTSSGRYYDEEIYEDLYDDGYMDEEGNLDELGELQFLEPFVIVGLVVAIMFLLYYRQQRQMAHRREQEEEERQRQRQGQQGAAGGAGVLRNQPAVNGGGFFPPPNNPAQADWLAGGSSPRASPAATASGTSVNRAASSSPAPPPGGARTQIRRRAAADQKEKEANARPSSTRAAGAGGSSSTMLRLYTDESPGLKVDPVVVLVLSLVFIFSVVALHIIAKVTRRFSS